MGLFSSRKKNKEVLNKNEDKQLKYIDATKERAKNYDAYRGIKPQKGTGKKGNK
jgi:hypothetical protein